MEIENISVTRGAATVVLSRATGDFVSIPERGLCYVAAGKLVSGDVWNITGYSVYTGILSELQSEVEGDPSDAARPGWRAATTRLQVMPPVVQIVGIGYTSVPVSGSDAATVSAAAKDALIAYLATLAPGAPLYVAQLYDAIMSTTDLLSIRFWMGGTSTPLDDVYPADDTVVRSDAANVNEV